MSALDERLPAELAEQVETRLVAAADDRIVERVWARDDTVWGEAGQPEVANRLGWLDIADRLAEETEDLRAFAAQVREDGLTDVVLLGMGGSSLAPEVLRQSFGSADGFPTLHVLDSTDAAAIRHTTERVHVDTTLFLVSTKSGGTIETLSAFEHFWSLKPDGAHYVAITDPGSSLVDLAAQHGFRRTFENDPDIGGRYSALSYFGVVPAALIGVDLDTLLQAAMDAGAAERAEDDGDGLRLGATMAEAAKVGRDKLTFLVCPPIASFGLWVEQLIAESTGKHGTGILPVADEPLGAPEAYGDDRVLVHLRNRDEPMVEHDELIAAAGRAGHPTITIEVPGDPALALGQLFVLWEMATAVAGWALGINPFDQPNVQEAKDNTKKALAEKTPEQADADDDALKVLVGQAAPPSYVAVMGYTAPDPEVDAAISALRAAIRDATKATTTYGYGPRFLHSTGQLHKGGPKEGRFLQLVAHVDEDVEIPNGTDAQSFEQLKRAQATGDLQTLRDHGLPAERVTLDGDDPAGSIRALTTRIEGIL